MTGGSAGDALVAGELDELLAGDLHRLVAQPDQAGVGVGDDLAHQVGAGAGLGELVDLGAQSAAGSAERGGRGVGGDGGDLVADGGVLEHDVGEVAAASTVSKATRWSHQPPAARARQTAARKNSKPARPRRIAPSLADSAVALRPCAAVADRPTPADDAVARRAPALRLVRRARRVLHRLVPKQDDVPDVRDRVAPGLRGLRARGDGDQRRGLPRRCWWSA